MGLFDSIKKKLTPSTAVGLLTGGVGGGITGFTANKITNGGTDKMLNGIGVGDLLLGKKAKDINPDEIANQIRNTQSKGVNELNTALDTPSADIVRQQLEVGKKSLLTGAQDARRNAQKMIAQRGLQGSSLGLATNRTIDQNTNKSLATMNAAAPGLIRDQQIKDATTRIGVGGINQGGINFNTIEGQRSGGVLGFASALAPTAGTIAGAVYGGPAGAAAGSKIGTGIGGALGQQQNPNQGAYNPNSYSMGNYNF